MNKKLMAGIAAIVLGMSMGGTVLADDLQNVDTTVVESIEENRGRFMTETGEVCTIANGQNGYELQVGSVEEGTIFYLSEDVLVFDVASKEFTKAADIKEGMTVSVIYPKDAPMMLSIPARCGAAQLVIIHSDVENVQLGYFNEELVNEENTLALNISEETVIKNSLGEEKKLSAEDIKNKDAMVVYSNTTRSIPAQTTPSFVLIMEAVEEKEEVQASKEGVVEAEEAEEPTYVAIRTLATENGFDVVWDHNKKVVTLSKSNEELKFTVGEVNYFYNKEKRVLEHPVKLEKGCVMIADKVFN